MSQGYLLLAAWIYMKEQPAGELASAPKTQHKYNKDLSRLR